MSKPSAPGEPELKVRPLKVTVVGDGTVGKTCLLVAYTTNSFPEENFLPTVFANHAMTLCVDQEKFSLTLWDTAGREEYEKLRPLSYPKASYVRSAAIILVGTKLDLKSGGGDIITKEEGKNLKSKIKANAFLQCSAKTSEGLAEVYIEAARAVMRNRK